PRSYMQFPDAEDGDINSRLGSLFSATGMIAVGPSAPWDESTPLRWCVRDSEQYLADVILECKSRFNIDPDRVFLMGHSMGGFGAYHHIQRSPDRFAGVAVSSGSWSLGYWPTIRGTPLAIFQGSHDARAGVRWHYTDVEYGRWTDKLLKRQDLDHEYFEHDGKHSVGYSKERIAAWFKAAGRLERDACSPHVTLASPVGFSRTYCFPVRHNRWLTLDEAATSDSNADIKYDELRSHSTGDFSSWRLEHRTSSRPGSTIDAVNEGDNRIVVTTQNVKRFTVWLQPRMIDPDKKVRIVVNGRTQFNGRVEPSLATALESYERRHDWGLVYPMKVELEPHERRE
ncbi:MAG: alpha/beta fold hydrolase, partial [Planctomycetia bacterium]|nr:alpha/beta fold hydrolase [Planctomycetia bacterium]